MNVRGYLAEQCRRDVATGVKWHGSGPAVGVTELLVRAALTHLHKAVGLKQRNGLPGLDRQAAHKSGDLDGSHFDELRLQLRFAFLEQHLDDLAQVLLQLVDVRSLDVCTGQPGT